MTDIADMQKGEPMGRLIDEQEAINAINDSSVLFCERKQIYDILRNLPSAQPELPDICDGCEVRFVHGCDPKCKESVLKRESLQSCDGCQYRTRRHTEYPCCHCSRAFIDQYEGEPWKGEQNE